MSENWMGDLINAQWLTDMVHVFMQILMLLAGIVLAPISIIIQNLIPDFSNSMTQISVVFDYALQYSSWFISAFGIPSAVIGMVTGYYTFAISAKLSTWTIKLALKWLSVFK